MRDCILHIGAGKCGSSALQAYLSSNPFIRSNDGQFYEYICIKKNGRVLRKSAIKRSADQNGFGYASSVSAQGFIDDDSLSQVKLALDEICSERIVPILSFEGWINTGRRFDSELVFEKLQIAPRIIAFVRPQIPWINSSWWQWGAWSGNPFDVWLDAWMKRGLWATAFDTWQRIAEVKSVEFYSTKLDVVSTFCRVLSLPQPAAPLHANKTLGGSVLRFLQRHPELRERAVVDFVLSEAMRHETRPTPWVLSGPIVEQLMEYYGPNNEKLRAICGDELREDINTNANWFSAASFLERDAEDPERGLINVEEYDAMLYDLTCSLIEKAVRTQ